MPIMGQCSFNALGLHDQEVGAIRETPILVSHILVAVQSPFKLIAGLSYHRHIATASQSLDCLRNRLAEPRVAVTEPVQEFDKDHLACDNLILRVILSSSHSLDVKLVARIEKRYIQ